MPASLLGLLAVAIDKSIHFYRCKSSGNQGGPNNKELPPFIGEAKVREIDIRKNFVAEFFACFQQVVNNLFLTRHYRKIFFARR